LQKLYNGEEVGDFGTLKLDSAQFKSISQALGSTEIRNLNLYGTQVTLSALKKLKKLKSSKLEILNLYCNSLFDPGVELLFSILPVTLTKLNLCNNGITEDGAVCISSFLACNPLLVTLDLSFNSLRSQGAILLLKSLLKNTHLMRLNLHRNSITNVIQETLFELIKENTRLVSLKLEYNPLGASILRSLSLFNIRNHELEAIELVLLRDQLVLTRKLALLKDCLPLEILFMISISYTDERRVAAVFLDRSTIGRWNHCLLFSPMNLLRQVALMTRKI
jgi:Ran GTPase-activating protein (RanGAP) involved in mRNA processing and transport